MLQKSFIPISLPVKPELRDISLKTVGAKPLAQWTQG